MFTKGQIVKGKVTGVFVVMGLKTVGGEPMVVVKGVNPDNHSQRAPGQICLPADALLPLA